MRLKIISIGALFICSMANASEYVSYEDLVRGMGPAESYIVGGNKLLEYVDMDGDYACRFMLSQTLDVNLQKIKHMYTEQVKAMIDSGQTDENLARRIANLDAYELFMSACKELDLAEQQINTRISLKNTGEELFRGDSGLFRMKFPNNGPTGIVLMKMERGVWKLKTISFD